MILRVFTAFLLSTTLVTAQSQTLFDISFSAHREAIEGLAEKGIVEGYPDGSFRPLLSINRAEFLKILMLAAYGDDVFRTGDLYCFSDFRGTVEWYYPMACAAKERGIIHGHPDGSFRGTDTVLLAEAVKMSVLAWDMPQPQYFRAPDNWYDPYMDAAASTRLYSVLPPAPGLKLNRDEAAGLLVALGQEIEDVSDAVSGPGPHLRSFGASDGQAGSGSDASSSSGAAVCGNGEVEFPEQCDDGNTEDGDGCSSICVIVDEPVRHGALRIEQRPLGPVDTAAGTSDLILLRFDALAGRQDIFIDQLKFIADTGSLEDGTNYRLYYDASGDGDAQTLADTAVPQNERLSFGSLDIPIIDGRYTRIELRGDVQSSGSIDDFSVRFDTSDDNYVEGTDAIDGRSVQGIETDNGSCNQSQICWIAVYTEPARLIRIAENGNLYVTEDSSPVPSRQLLLGTQTDQVLRLVFFAEGEDVEVTTIRIGGGSSSIDFLELYEEDDDVPFALARESACSDPATGMFCADTSLFVRKDRDVEVRVHAAMNPDTRGGTSGETATLTLTASTGGNAAVEARGDASLIDLSQNDGDGTAEGEIFIGRNTPGGNNAITGNTHDIVGAKIINIINCATDTDETPVPNGDRIFAEFCFTAAAHSNTQNGLNNVILESLTFQIEATNTVFASNSIVLLNTANTTDTHTCSMNAVTGSISVVCSSLEGSSVSTAIEQGQTIRLALQGNISPNDPATLQTSIGRLGDRSSLGTVQWHDEVTTFQWVDIGTGNVRSTVYRTR